MQHCVSNECCNVKPNGNVQMSFSSAKNCSEHVPSESHPYHCDQNINGPLKLRVFFSCRVAEQQCYRSEHNDELPSPEMDFAQRITEHSRFQKTLKRVIHSHENSIPNKRENDSVGVNGTNSSERSVRQFKIKYR